MRLTLQHTPRYSRYVPRYPNRIREYRLRAGLSQQELATRLGRGPGAISSWERGLSFPGYGVVLRLAKRLNTLVESLYYDLYAADRFFENEADEDAFVALPPPL